MEASLLSRSEKNLCDLAQPSATPHLRSSKSRDASRKNNELAISSRISSLPAALGLVPRSRHSARILCSVYLDALVGTSLFLDDVHTATIGGEFACFADWAVQLPAMMWILRRKSLGELT
jgi:hypothetical protein